MTMYLNRTVGIEMEGYVDTYPERIELPHGADIGRDGSLSNDDWDWSDEAYGIEVRTRPFQDLNEVYAIVRELEGEGWDVNNSAGTHIHVDISDFDMLDKAKLIRFGKGIERIMFALVEEYRYGNDYCEPISKGWRSLFWRKGKYREVDWANMSRHSPLPRGLWNGKYQWLNVLGSHYPTVEYRIFHAVRSADDVIKQAQLAYGIVELVKNSTVEQLEFIIKEINNQPTVDEVFSKFFEVVGVEPMRIYTDGQAYQNLKLKVENKEQEGEEVVV